VYRAKKLAPKLNLNRKQKKKKLLYCSFLSALFRRVHKIAKSDY